MTKPSPVKAIKAWALLTRQGGLKAYNIFSTKSDALRSRFPYEQGPIRVLITPEVQDAE